MECGSLSEIEVDIDFDSPIERKALRLPSLAFSTSESRNGVIWGHSTQNYMGHTSSKSYRGHSIQHPTIIGDAPTLNIHTVLQLLSLTK